MTGNIPQNLTIFTQLPIEVSTNWDHSNDSMQTLTVSPAFITDSKNAKTQKTALEWATGRCWDGCASRYANTETIPNGPFTDVRIVSLEHRGNGGRAYKVIVDGKYYDDLREDVLLDMILTVGIAPNGKLRGEYVFAMVNSQMKIVRLGSQLHKDLVDLTSMRTEKPISTFEIGKTYFRASSAEFGEIYIGEFYQQEISANEVWSGYNRGYHSGITKQNHGHNWNLTISPTQKKFYMFVDSKCFDKPWNVKLLKTLPKVTRESSDIPIVSKDEINNFIDRLKASTSNPLKSHGTCYYSSDIEYYLKYTTLTQGAVKQPPMTVNDLLALL